MFLLNTTLLLTYVHAAVRIKIVTPLNYAGSPVGYKGWDITIILGKVTLTPSIGNSQLPCKSHYWITDNKIVTA